MSVLTIFLLEYKKILIFRLCNIDFNERNMALDIENIKNIENIEKCLF